MNSLKTCITIASLMCLSSIVQAEVLTLDDLSEMSFRLGCLNQCQQQAEELRETCYQTCPPEQGIWHKNNVAPVNEKDWNLAMLEYWDEGSMEYICKDEDDWIHTKAVCGCVKYCIEEGNDCGNLEHPCIDDDGDGLVAWEEQEIYGTEDSKAQTFCADHSQCAGFTENCQYLSGPNRSLCLPRECKSTSTCTAFHLETIVADYQELIVHVHFDYAPTPVTVLELYLNFDKQALTLLEARPLPLLSGVDKQVASTLTRSGMRLAIIGPGSTKPIPQGAIVEVIFMRHNGLKPNLEFTDNDYLQTHAMAPHQGNHQEELADDSLWGGLQDVGGASEHGDRLMLYYSFDNPNQMLDYNEGQRFCLDSETCGLCKDEKDCALASGPDQTKHKSQLAALQRGWIQTSQAIPGVLGPGVYLDGYADHLELPIVLNKPAGQEDPYDITKQGFSLSMWFYVEAGELSQQLIFSHNNSSENTHFGLLFEPTSSTNGKLMWFADDVTNVPLTTEELATDLPLDTWTHLGLNVDFSTEPATATCYLNGQQAGGVQTFSYNHNNSYPVFDRQDRTMDLHQEGTEPAKTNGARSPEMLLLSAQEEGKYNIEQMDTNGLVRQKLIYASNYSVRDPDYSPIVDKLVYVSEAGEGNSEIWIANRDGTDRKQVTLGFGDTSRGIFARRPRWAPDATGIVFESNIYSVMPGKMDNWWQQTSQLYYIAYDPIKNRVAIPFGSSTIEQLDYEALLVPTSQSHMLVEEYRLTSGAHQHSHASWIKKGQTNVNRGVLVYSQAEPDFSARSIWKLTVNTDGKGDSQVPLVEGTESASARFLAASGYTAETTDLLYALEESSMKQSDQFRFEVEPLDGDSFAVSIIHDPTGYEEECMYEENGEQVTCCWDLNRNRHCDSEENRNNDTTLDEFGNEIPLCDINDCYTAGVQGLYLSYDVSQAKLDTEATIAANEETVSADLGKSVSVQALSVSEDEVISIEIRPGKLENQPLPAGSLIAKLIFTGDATAIASDALKKRKVISQLMHKILNSGQNPEEIIVSSGSMEQVLEATFSPDGKQALLYGIQQARPALVKLILKDDLPTVEKLSVVPEKISGLTWVKQDRYYPANWIGAYREPDTRQFVKAFHGGLDEIKMYSYIRSPKAFVSTYQRGLERVEAQYPNGIQPVLPPCISNAECPAYHLCIQGQCQVVPCDEKDPYACKPDHGQCTLAPSYMSQNKNPWVCSVECSGERECYSQQCMNGPCRFCGENGTCIECEEKPVEIFGQFVPRVVGCPDQNSYACDEGSCYSECYSTEDGQSRYLCAEGVEYCHKGRCEPLRWTWRDLGPGTWSGVAEPLWGLSGLKRSAALDKLYSIEIEAYGVSDYLHPPELLVEGKLETDGKDVYGENWFDLGRILVYNVTPTEARNDKEGSRGRIYTLYTQYPVRWLRLRLINPPYENLNAASLGVLPSSLDSEWCRARVRAWAEENGTDPDYAACENRINRAPGSRASLGYRVGIPEHEKRQACHDRTGGTSSCGYDSQGRYKYLFGGQPAIVVEAIRVNGVDVFNNIEDNWICSWENSLEPKVSLSGRLTQMSGRQKKIFFGDVLSERSNQKDTFFSGENTPSIHTDLLSWDAKTRNFALLNCNYANDESTAGSDGIARIEVNLSDLQYVTDSPGIQETEEHCLYTTGINAKPCYEWQYNTGNIDVMNLWPEPQVTLKTIEVDLVTSFGWSLDDLPEPLMAPEQKESKE